MCGSVCSLTAQHTQCSPMGPCVCSLTVSLARSSFCPLASSVHLAHLRHPNCSLAFFVSCRCLSYLAQLSMHKASSQARYLWRYTVPSRDCLARYGLEMHQHRYMSQRTTHDYLTGARSTPMRRVPILLREPRFRSPRLHFRSSFVIPNALF
jgi:hypothetical protein